MPSFTFSRTVQSTKFKSLLGQFWPSSLMFDILLIKVDLFVIVLLFSLYTTAD